MEHKTCKGCKWNNYPACKGTIIDGIEMNIEKLNISFLCGVKDMDNIHEISRMPSKSDLELRVEVLEEKVNELETKKV